MILQLWGSSVRSPTSPAGVRMTPAYRARTWAMSLLGTSNYTLMLRFERRLNSVVAVIGVGMTRLELFLRPACRCGGI